MKKYTVVFTPEAIEEICHAVHWYNERQKGLGKRFKTQFKKNSIILNQIHFLSNQDEFYTQHRN